MTLHSRQGRTDFKCVEVAYLISQCNTISHAQLKLQLLTIQYVHKSSNNGHTFLLTFIDHYRSTCKMHDCPCVYCYWHHFYFGANKLTVTYKKRYVSLRYSTMCNFLVWSSVKDCSEYWGRCLGSSWQAKKLINQK